MKIPMLAGVVIVLASALTMAAESGPLAHEEHPEHSRGKKMEKMGALRGRVILKLQGLRNTMDSGGDAQATYNRIKGIQGRILQNAERQLRAEMNKTREMQDRALIETLKARQARVQEMWQDFYENQWARMSERSREQQRAVQMLEQVFEGVANRERVWLDAGLDLDALISVLGALDQRLDEVKASVDAPGVEVKKTLAAWESLEKE
jgi:hypothetical protein